VLVTLIVRCLIWLVGLAAVLFIAAGTVAWPAAWLFLVELGGCALATGIWLAVHDPALLAERLRSPIQRGQERWDQILIAVAAVLWLGWIVVIALDAARWRPGQVPLWGQAVGALGLLVSMALVQRTFRENSYAAPAVKIQTARAHRVVATGPYRVVRHPMYAAVVLNFLTTPLLLGSWLGLALAPLLIVGLAVRAVLEERTLAAKLDGYVDYLARVRYRFVPGLW
jgi:protein-S-isoprenylcysteine O-methyltransferase Ste14